MGGVVGGVGRAAAVAEAAGGRGAGGTFLSPLPLPAALLWWLRGAW